MPGDFQGVQQQLIEALDALDWKSVTSLTQTLGLFVLRSPDEVVLPDLKKILDKLKRKRRFSDAALLAQNAILAVTTDAKTHRILAQALIDLGHLYAADRVLLGIDGLMPNDFEKSEVLGLRGRVYKQLYMNANAKEAAKATETHLKKSTGFYEEGYAGKAENYYHGINAIALSMRAVRDELGPPSGLNTLVELGKLRDYLKTLIAKRLSGGETPWPWERATLLECYVALNKQKEARDIAESYVDPDLKGDSLADAFEIGSTLRQLEEVWQLRADDEQSQALLKLLRGALLKREGGALTVTADQARTGVEFESVTANDAFNNVKWYEQGLQRCSSIACVARKGGLGVGTGWMVRESDFFPGASAGAMLLLTNAHVIPSTVKFEIAEARFEVAGETVDFDGVVRCSTPESGLDYCFLRMKSVPANVQPIDIEKFDKDIHQRAYVIGHAFGSQLTFSMQNSQVAGSNQKVVHYHTSTAGGSSGSPVFEQFSWKAVALHHGANPSERLDGSVTGEYKVNEGILLSSIQADIA